MDEKKKKRVRYHALDTFRGMVFVSMALYHAMWDMVYLSGFKAEWYQGRAGYVWQQSICWSFIVLSGFCWSFGRAKYRRGVMIFAAGLLVTFVTVFFMPEDRVLFGVLTFLGTASVFVTAVQPCLFRCSPYWGLGFSAVFFFLTRNVNRGWLGFEGCRLVKLPDILYQNLGTAFLGFPGADFYSTDYFSLFPWIFLYLCGYFCYRILEKKNILSVFEKGNLPFFSWMGRHCLLLYLLHQPVLFGLMHVLQSIS